MKLLRKLTVLLLAMVFVVSSLAGCGSSTSDTQSTATGQQTTQTQKAESITLSFLCAIERLFPDGWILNHIFSQIDRINGSYNLAKRFT